MHAARGWVRDPTWSRMQGGIPGATPPPASSHRPDTPGDVRMDPFGNLIVHV